MDEYVRTHDVGDELIRYIGTQEYERAVANMSMEAQSAFLSGIGMAGTIIMARCRKYYADTSTHDQITEENREQ